MPLVLQSFPPEDVCFSSGRGLQVAAVWAVRSKEYLRVLQEHYASIHVRAVPSAPGLQSEPPCLDIGCAGRQQQCRAATSSGARMLWHCFPTGS